MDDSLANKFSKMGIPIINAKDVPKEVRVAAIDATKINDGECQMCGANKELRPYGPNGENVCFNCAMKDEEMTRRRFMQAVFREQLDS